MHAILRLSRSTYNSYRLYLTVNFLHFQRNGVADVRNRGCLKSQPSNKNSAKVDSKALQVIVQTPSGKYVVLQFCCTSTGYDLGSHISAACGVAVKHQMLFCNNKQTDLHKSLQIQDVVSDSTITMNLKLNGGGGKHN